MSRSAFLSWLQGYKQFSSAKAIHTCNRLDVLSKLAIDADVYKSPIYTISKYSELGKWKMGVARIHALSSSEKNDLELYGYFIDYASINKESLIGSAKTNLQEYCESMKMSYSYKAVLLLVFLENSGQSRRVSVDNLVEYMIDYYRQRLTSNKTAEQSSSPFSSLPIDFCVSKKNIINNPIAALEKARVICSDASGEYISLAPEYYISIEESGPVIDACKKRLSEYYERISRDSNSALSSLDQLRAAIIGISSDKERADCLDALNNYLKENSNNNCSRVYSDLFIQPGDSRKVGLIVRESFKALSDLGYVFGEDLFANCLSKEWSNKVLGLHYALFKLYDPSIPIKEQRLDYRGNGRYYKEIYQFGDKQVLITSEWYIGDRERFIAWFNSLVVQ